MVKQSNASKSKTQQKTNAQAKNAWQQQSKNEWQSSKSKSTEFAQDVVRLNDADIISDVLTTHKGLVKMYGTAIVETDCENLREIYTMQMSECAEDQFDAFLYMNERGLYPTEQAPAPKVKQAKKLFASKEKTFDM